MKLKFTVSERLSSDSLFPKDDDMITLRLARGIKDKISLSSKEMQEVNLKIINTQQGSRYTWDDSKVGKVDKEYNEDFTEVEIRFLKERVTKLNETKKVPDALLDICEKIIDSEAKIPVDKISENNKDKSPEEASKQN